MGAAIRWRKSGPSNVRAAHYAASSSSATLHPQARLRNANVLTGA